MCTLTPTRPRWMTIPIELNLGGRWLTSMHVYQVVAEIEWRDMTSMSIKLAMVLELRFVLCLMITIEVLCVAADAFKFKLKPQPPPAMYVFGDSALDVGNNKYLPGAIRRVNGPYYGVDFPGGVPTGRFSNGYNTADFIARCIGLLCSPPPYLSLVPPANSDDLLVSTALTAGVNYASGGAGILDSTNAGKTIPLSKQVEYFNATRSAMIAAATAAAGSSPSGSDAVVDALINQSFFLISIGGNDVLAFTSTEQAARNTTTAADLFGSLISSYSAAVKNLHALGARRLAVVGLGLTGCLPVSRAVDPTGACAEDRNTLAAGFNAALRSMLAGDDLAAGRLPGGLAYSFADVLGLMADTIADPCTAGFVDVAGACCGGGRLNAEAACSPNATLCADRGLYYFWDNVHPTERAAKLRAQAFCDGPAQYTTPVNFKQLAHMR